MILVFGSINVDLVVRVEAIPRPGETVLAPAYETLFGGKGANQAVAAARATAHGRVAIAARVGDDGFGRDSRANLAANAVGIDLVVAGPESTGCAFIVVDAAGENAITVASGANRKLEATAVPTEATDAGPTLILQMEVPLAASLAVARRVRAAGGRVIWNLAPVPTDLPAAELRTLMELTNVLVVNEHEARAASALLGHVDVSLERAGALLAKIGGLACVVTAGGRGAFAYLPDGTETHTAATAVDPVDTTGAGDTFVGILAAGLDEGRPLAEVMQRACHGASLACLVLGAQAGMPDAVVLNAARPMTSI